MIYYHIWYNHRFTVRFFCVQDILYQRIYTLKVNNYMPPFICGEVEICNFKFYVTIIF